MAGMEAANHRPREAVRGRRAAGRGLGIGFDELNRLTQAPEGTWNGSSITTKTRQSDWVLDQFGSFTTYKQDANGDGDWVDTGDINDNNTFDVGFKITARKDQKTTPETVSTPTNAANGTLTNDGRTDKMVYDAWNRLRQVQNQASAVRATYRYNGLGHRIAWHDDADNDADVDGSDPVYHLAYTEDWRMVAVYRGSDANPKERHLPHMAGINGFGHVGGPDGQILYDKDTSTAWASAADGTLDARRYICQNHRGDVSAIITDIAWQVESIRYTAYGEPTALPGGDTDSDGDFDATDAGNIIGWTTGYDARYDVNVDGLIDADDLSDAIAVNGGGYLTSGRGILSGTPTNNRKGYAGYEHDRVMPARLAHVRHRAYRMDLGRSLQPTQVPGPALIPIPPTTSCFDLPLDDCVDCCVSEVIHPADFDPHYLLYCLAQCVRADLIRTCIDAGSTQSPSMALYVCERCCGQSTTNYGTCIQACRQRFFWDEINPSAPNCNDMCSPWRLITESPGSWAATPSLVPAGCNCSYTWYHKFERVCPNAACKTTYEESFRREWTAYRLPGETCGQACRRVAPRDLTTPPWLPNGPIDRVPDVSPKTRGSNRRGCYQ